MQTKLTITKAHESYGDTGRRYHQSDSELVAELRYGTIILSLKEGERRSPTDTPQGMQSAAESVAAVHLSPDNIRVLVAFLSALPADA